MASEKPVPRPVVGPILHFRGEEGDRWRLSALFVFEGTVEPDDLMVEGVSLPVPPRHVFVWRGRHVWRFVFSVPRGNHDRRISYGFPERGASWAMTIPGQHAKVRLAYTTANGIADEYGVSSLPQGPAGMWTQLLKLQGDTPYHLLIQGGDQIYADNLWADCSALTQWWAQPEPARYTQPFTRIMADQAMDYYFNAYCAALARPDYARAMASIPSIMMWDDHDIFDGWGSRPEAEHLSQVYRGLFAVARRQFSLFQLGAAIRDPLDSVWGAAVGSFTQGFRVGDIGILMLDLRSERSRTQVLSEATWKELPGWLARFQGCKQVLLVSSVPVAFIGMGWLEAAINTLRPGSDVDDDLRDQWRSPAHRPEWLRLLKLLSDFSLRHRCRLTVLSGEVNLGAAAVVRGGGVDLWQLIAPGVVHPPVGALLTAGLRRLVRSPERVSDDYVVEMPRFAETRQRFIRARGFLSLGFDRQNHLIARWHSEATPDHYDLVI
ncbi:MAG: alkaline phosphatase D family protein [Rhodospirillaceae bacterium]